jgi:hypothetical protein
VSGECNLVCYRLNAKLTVNQNQFLVIISFSRRALFREISYVTLNLKFTVAGGTKNHSMAYDTDLRSIKFIRNIFSYVECLTKYMVQLC